MKTGNILPSKITSSPPRWSITRQLAWWIAFAASVLLIFASGFLYWILIATLEQEDENFLYSRIRVLETILREQPENTQAVEREIAEESTRFADSQYLIYSRILDESGRTLHEAPGMKQEIPTSAFPAPQELPAKVEKWHSSTNKTYLLIAAWAGGGASSEPTRRQIQVALDETGETLLVSRYERYLISVLLAGILASALIGILIARRGMKPLADIASAAEHITANQLHKRIDTASWPRELALLARAFDGMLDRLEDSFNRLSQFSADLAHELRTPLNNLRGEAEVALSKPRTTDEYQEILASSLEEYDRLSRMVDSLLFLAKADNAHAMAARTPVDTRVEIEKMIIFYDALAAEQNVEVTCIGSGMAYADPDLFQQVIGNLLVNALHHTPSGGTIVFSINPEREQGIEIICQDSGTGIAQEHLPRIFDRFYRVDPLRDAKAEGEGLGLAIVKSIIGLHRGEITVQSTVGQGTSVRLFFPAISAESA